MFFHLDHSLLFAYFIFWFIYESGGKATYLKLEGMVLYMMVPMCRPWVPHNFGLLVGVVADGGYEPESLHAGAALVGWPALKWAQAQAVLRFSHREIPDRTTEAS